MASIPVHQSEVIVPTSWPRFHAWRRSCNEWSRRTRASVRKKFQEKNYVDDDLETALERKERQRSIYVIYFTMFLMSLAFSIVLTGNYPYLNKLFKAPTKEFMGLVVAANPFAQMLFSPLVGWWGNRRGSVRLPLLLSLALFTIASALYSALEIIPIDRKVMLVASRFLVGVSSANIALARSYLSAATRFSERTQAVSMISLAQVLGFVVGPLLQSIVVPLGEDTRLVMGLPMNMYSAAGWINVLLGMLNFYLFLPCSFKERKIAAREAMRNQGKASEKETWKSMKPDYLGSWSLISAFFILVFNFVLIETLGSPLTMDQFAWDSKTSTFYMGILLGVGAAVAVIAFVLIGPMCKKFDERRIMLWGGFFLMIIGRIIFIPWGPDPPLIAELGPYNNETHNEDGTRKVGCPSTQEWCRDTLRLTEVQFIIGFGFTTIGYPVGVTLIQTIFSKVLGPRPQGVWMGLMTGAGCASRVVGPLFVTMIYEKYGLYWTFGVTGSTLVVSMIHLSLVYKHLVPLTSQNQHQADVPLVPMGRNEDASDRNPLGNGEPLQQSSSEQRSEPPDPS
ncbi:major facilitator superfamily domain-containing protein 8 [Trichogramma pretiosum]|uniref:major facilitator superfamily domain-containing protein 8 n=1 Tax=Trichogramma pretiosum TaxID=7493 RepID=UPI0006C972C3|nr:major facilitator superfamily domain-containing protein 8 [Trichogramma pretiosum]XP_014236235.1 major facilitator superfamily domain-containing protein 8 [Trichogramma pretiosum]XP_014236236.1 major facilitator superfamily domain-containing protein 8 [Trichogramma pretiosum]XP_014236237.1 major facilitator superfamily domain-containing protein 8 [Trichogramma pretiosum]XP_014236238.1 major facilitator superfamily domain-containing protein 8 [Trichogramma pretiosum]